MPDSAILIPLFVIAILAGAVRGFSGFGAAMTFVPIAAVIVGPATAVVLIFILDLLPSWAMLPGATRRCTWHEVLPLALGAGLTIPIGAWLLVNADPVALRWAMPLLSLIAVGLLASGWRYAGVPGRTLSGLVGGTAGFLGGLTSFYGPPIVLFWLGGPAKHATVRANLIVFFAFTSIIGGVSYASHGLLSRDLIILGLVLLPAYGAAMWAGARLFGRASEATFRLFAYGLIAMAALVSLPVW
jgi:uncharacterized membrane protein YfcA